MKQLYFRPGKAAWLSVFVIFFAVALSTASAQQCGTGMYYQAPSASQLIPVTPPYSVTVKTFPNPTHGLVTVSFEANKDLRDAPAVLVTNPQGQVVAKASGAAEGQAWSTTFDLRTFGPGVFFIRTNCKECPVQKVVVSDQVNP
jgi:hypothetical protein